MASLAVDQEHADYGFEDGETYEDVMTMH